MIARSEHKVSRGGRGRESRISQSRSETWHERVVSPGDATVWSYDISSCEKRGYTNTGIELHCIMHILPSLTTGEAWSLCDRVQKS